MYNYTNQTTQSLLTEHQATIDVLKAGTLSGFWSPGARATVHRIEDELTSRGVSFKPWLS